MSRGDTEFQTLENLRDAAAEGHFWIASTSIGRAKVDYAVPLLRLIELAMESLQEKSKV